MAKVVFIGLGNMGGPMAINLLKAGHQVTGFDLSEAAVKRHRDAGGQTAATIGDAVAQADTVVTMLPAGKHVKSVYLGEDGLLSRCAKSAVLIDSSTIDVESARAVAAEAEKADVRMVDAPVSGGVGGAEAG
ncbi:MAG: NAD(P)-binding domain-containing protein, partial [Stappiaceae bacterium]